MTPEVANIAMQFLQRVDLKGGEVDAFNAVVRELNIDIRQIDMGDPNVKTKAPEAASDG